MKINGESIYGTTASPLKPFDWGRCTQKPGRLYLHVFDWPQGELLIPDLKSKVKKAYLLGDSKREPLAVSQSEKGVKIKLPSEAPDKLDTVIVLEILPL